MSLGEHEDVLTETRVVTRRLAASTGARSAASFLPSATLHGHSSLISPSQTWFGWHDTV